MLCPEKGVRDRNLLLWYRFTSPAGHLLTWQNLFPGIKCPADLVLEIRWQIETFKSSL